MPAYAGMSAVRAKFPPVSLAMYYVHVNTLHEAGRTGVLTRDNCELSITKDLGTDEAYDFAYYEDVMHTCVSDMDCFIKRNPTYFLHTT